MGNKNKPKKNVKATLKRKRELATRMRERKKMRLTTDAQATFMSSEQHLDSLVYENLDMPSSSTSRNTEGIKLQTNAQTSIPSGQHMKSPVYANIDSPYSSAAKSNKRLKNQLKQNSQDDYSMTETIFQNAENSTTQTPKLPYNVEADIGKTLNNYEIRGNRIIEVNNFFNELIKISAHNSLFNCGLHSMILKGELQKVLKSTFKLHCSLCNKDFEITNSVEDLNKNAVAGVMAAGCGYAQLKQFTAALDLPKISAYKYKISQEEICDEWEVTAWEEMKKAGECEKEAAPKDGNVDKDGIPIIDVVVDGSWCKRSYTRMCCNPCNIPH